MILILSNENDMHIFFGWRGKKKRKNNYRKMKEFKS